MNYELRIIVREKNQSSPIRLEQKIMRLNDYVVLPNGLKTMLQSQAIFNPKHLFDVQKWLESILSLKYSELQNAYAKKMTNDKIREKVQQDLEVVKLAQYTAAFWMPEYDCFIYVSSSNK